MPYPNEHACRLKPPGKYSRFSRGTRKSKNGKIYSIIFGILSPGKSEEQAYRYKKSTWQASEARSHCSRHGGQFEAASGTSARNVLFSAIIKATNSIRIYLKGD